MTKKKLSKSVLKQIKDKEIKPRPRWHFLLSNILFWLLFLISAVLGARAIGVMIFTFTEIDFGLVARAKGHFLLPWLRLFPSFWLIFFLLFIVAASYGLHQTKNAYRMPLSNLLLINLGLSFLLGLVSFQFGDAERFEGGFQMMPFYENIEHRQMNVWSEPEEGRLSGKIIAIKSDEILILDDFSKQEWTVDYKDAEIAGALKLEEGETVRMTGDITEANHFEAEFVSPWKANAGKKPKGGLMPLMPPPPTN